MNWLMSPELDGSGNPSKEPLALHSPLVTDSSNVPLTVTLNQDDLTGGHSLEVREEMVRWPPDVEQDLYGTAISHDTGSTAMPVVTSNSAHSSRRIAEMIEMIERGGRRYSTVYDYSGSEVTTWQADAQRKRYGEGESGAAPAGMECVM